MNSVAVFTAIYGGYDTLHELPAQDVPVDTAICVTDDPTLRSGTWDVLHEPRPDVHPNRAAKRPKFLPWTYADTTHSIWVDASFRVTSPSFVSGLLTYARPLAQFRHQDRDCIYEEAAYSLGWSKYSGEPLAEQTARYRRAGHPERWGLWTTGVQAREHTPHVRELGERWAAEVDAWSFQDQVSQAPILRDVGFRPVELPGCYWTGQNPWVAWEGSPNH